MDKGLPAFDKGLSVFDKVGPGSALARVAWNPVFSQREAVGQALEPDFARDPATFPGNRGQIADPETPQWRTVDDLLSWRQMCTISLSVRPSVRRAIIAACGLLAVVLWTSQVSATSSGSTYYLEYKAALGDAPWPPAAQVLGDGAVQTLTDPGATAPQRFHRLLVN